MAKTTQTVSGLTLSLEKPTTLTFKQLFNWVIWQVPTSVENAFSGAVKPPTADSKWYPALIQVKEKKVQVYAHEDILFDTPEEATNYLCKR